MCFLYNGNKFAFISIEHSPTMKEGYKALTPLLVNTKLGDLCKLKMMNMFLGLQCECAEYPCFYFFLDTSLTGTLYQKTDPSGCTKCNK